MALITLNYSTNFFAPIIILLAIGCLVPLLLSLLKLKYIPTFVVEIIVGICIANWFNKYMASINMTSMVDGLYVFGLTFIMFLSGYEVDFSIIKENEKNYRLLNISVAIVIGIYLVSFGLSWAFIEDYSSRLFEKVMLITLAFASIFAGLVVPLLNKENATNSNIGKIIVTIANISEFCSIIFLSLFMIFVETNEGYWWFSIVMIVLIIITYVMMKKGKDKINPDFSEGIVHLPVRLLMLSILLAVFLSDLSGGEYILGAFLMGMLIKILDIKKSIHAIEKIVFGLFAPIFYVLIGTKIDIMVFIEKPELLLTVLYICLAIIVARLPMLVLLRWFSLKLVIPTVIISTSTIVVTIAINHIGYSIGLFSEEFGDALLLASLITCIIPPILFEKFIDFDLPQKENTGVNIKNE